MKILLNILEVAGITHIERAADTVPIKEFKGPVLDYSCAIPVKQMFITVKSLDSLLQEACGSVKSHHS